MASFISKLFSSGENTTNNNCSSSINNNSTEQQRRPGSSGGGVGGGTSASAAAAAAQRDPYWLDDAKVKACYECEAPFGLLVRRHHCRVCGRIFCASCAANSIAPPPGSADQQWQRVCNHCEF